MQKLKINDKYFKKYISSDKVQKTVETIAEQIRNDYKDKTPLYLIIANGAIFFATDLIREAAIDCEVHCIKVQSYGNDTKSSGTVKISMDLPEIKDKDVIIIEDIVDSGLTLFELSKILKDKGANSISIATLFSKPEMLKYDVKPKYIGFEIDPHFIIGYGLDYAQKGRYLKDIYIIDEE